MIKTWVFYLGFVFAVGTILFLFVGIPYIAYLGITRKVKFLPSFDDLLKEFPKATDDIAVRPPYNKLDYSTSISVLYVELIISLFLIKVIKLFKRGKGS